MPFQLQVKLTGLCVFGIHGADKKIVVVMPDTRFRRDGRGAVVPMRHADGDAAVPHVGYVRFNLANLSSTSATGVPHTNIATAPPYEVTHRFNQESLDFGLAPDAQDITNHELRLPNFDDFAPVKEPMPTAFGDDPATTPPSVLMRTVLTGGTIRSTGTMGEDWYFNGDLRPDGQRTEGYYNGDVQWIRDVDANELTLTIKRFKPETGDSTVTINLKPTSVGSGRQIIPLKIANLCATNPMEWRELDMRQVRGADKDFKWFYNLLQLKSQYDPTEYPTSLVPHPHPVDEYKAKEGMLVDCWPSMISL